MTRTGDNKKKENKKRTFRLVGLVIQTDSSAKLQESEKRVKYPDFARVQNKLWNMKVTVIPIVKGALGTITKGLLKRQEDIEIRKQVETIQIDQNTEKRPRD